MNCFEFRRRIGADPKNKDPELLEHRQTCRTCAAYVAQQTDFERALTEVLQVPTPSELHARIILNQTTHRIRWRRMLPYAAGILITLTVLSSVWWQSTPVGLDQQVLAHILNEAEHLHERGRVSRATLVRVLQTVGLPPNTDIGEVHFAENCPFANGRGAHLVLAGQKGPVTVLYMPGDSVRTAQVVTGKGLNGVILPAGRGSMAVVGEPDEDLKPIEHKLQRSLLSQLS